MSQLPFLGRHRTKIGAPQTASQETLTYAQSLNAHVLGPGDLAISEWQAHGLTLPDLPAIRRYRLQRLREQLQQRDYAGIILYDPINIRYATDSTNMQVWTLHNAARYCFVATDGPVILFDYHGCGHLSEHLELVDEVRRARSWYFMGAGHYVPDAAARWASELNDLIEHYGRVTDASPLIAAILKAAIGWNSMGYNSLAAKK